jgi:hypothetical protein
VVIEELERYYKKIPVQMVISAQVIMIIDVKAPRNHSQTLENIP